MTDNGIPEPHAHPHAGGGFTSTLTKKIGPAPGYVYVIGIVGLFVAYRWYTSRQSGTAVASTSTVGTDGSATNGSAIDPITGESYSQELAAATASQSAAAGASSTSPSTTVPALTTTQAILQGKFLSYIGNLAQTGPGQGIYGITDAGQYVHITPEEWSLASSQGATATYITDPTFNPNAESGVTDTSTVTATPLPAPVTAPVNPTGPVTHQTTGPVSKLGPQTDAVSHYTVGQNDTPETVATHFYGDPGAAGKIQGDVVPGNIVTVPHA